MDRQQFEALKVSSHPQCLIQSLCAIQAWLQKFAWTDSSLKTKISKRNALPQDEALLEKEPMFCFETAVKLLYWSAFVYEHGEVSSSCV